MKCPNCGRELNENDKFCVGCGTKIDNGMSINVASTMNSMNEFAGKMVNNATRSVMGTSKNGINFMVRRYFFGFGDFLWISFITYFIFSIFKFSFGRDYYGYSNGFGTFCTAIQVIAMIVFIGSLILDIYTRIIGMGKSNVDEATQNSIAKLKARAQEKFNVDIDQIKEIEPIVVAGAGKSPTSLVVGIATEARRYVGFFRRFYSKDPIEAYRFGYDGVPRYLLIQTTYYAFTDTQLLTYSGNMDISTGIIYDEKVSETFYKDVNSITQQEVLKKFKVGIFKKRYYTLRYLELDICGISKLASFDSRFAANADASLAGMESYIREKKSQ